MIVGNWLGYPDPTRINPRQLDTIIDLLRTIKKEAQAGVLTLGPLLDRLESGATWIATSGGWEGFPRMAKERGADVRTTHFRGGDHGWMDSWCIVNGAPHEDLAYVWIDRMIGAYAQRLGCNHVMLGSVNRSAVETLDAEIKATFPHDRLDEVFAGPGDVHMPPLDPVEGLTTLDDWERAWERVKLG